MSQPHKPHSIYPISNFWRKRILQGLGFQLTRTYSETRSKRTQQYNIKRNTCEFRENRPFHSLCMLHQRQMLLHWRSGRRCSTRRRCGAARGQRWRDCLGGWWRSRGGRLFGAEDALLKVHQEIGSLHLGKIWTILVCQWGVIFCFWKWANCLDHIWGCLLILIDCALQTSDMNRGCPWFILGVVGLEGLEESWNVFQATFASTVDLIASACLSQP